MKSSHQDVPSMPVGLRLAGTWTADPPPGWPGQLPAVVQPIWESSARLSHGGIHEQAEDRPGRCVYCVKRTAI